MTEAELQAAVLQAAQLFKWRVHHCKPAQTPDGKWLTRIAGNRGFPDLCLVRPPRVLFVELKSAKGRLSPDQTQWLQDLEKSGVKVAIWRPGDWTDGTITEELR